ncbi:MAG TPA: GNAT family N-acetyltransferase [Vicinamibacterales bacterium]|nr:GNAT family N-acetyltransferase [Vicinamibacterales bacterium]
MKASIEIELLGATPDDDLVRTITELVNRVYVVAEDGLWVQGATRTTISEMAELIAAGQIAVARLDGQLAGAVRIQQLDARTGEFGMLVADPAHRGEGIGRRLVAFAEETSRRRGLTVMQLELLVPREWTHPTKAFLHAWYTRIGYRPVQSGTIDESYPRLAPLLATPCDLVVYHKELTSSAGRG